MIARAIAGRRSGAARLLVVALALVASRARAEQCPAIAGADADAGLAAIDAGQRLAFIRAELDADALHRKRWMVGWTSAMAGLTAVPLGVAPFVDADSRIDMYVTAGKSFVGLADVLYNSFTTLGGPRRLEGSGDEPATCARLAEAERLLVKNAAGEVLGRAWWNHALNLVFNGAVGVVHSVVWSRYPTGPTSAVIGMAVGELMINTMPDEAVGALGRYRMGRLAPSRGPAVTLSVAPALGSSLVGLQLAGSF